MSAVDIHAQNFAETRIGDWMQTAHGRVYWPRDPRPEEVFLDDIIVHISNQARFGGGMKPDVWYGVGQHVLLVAEIVQSAVMRDPMLSPYPWRVTTALALAHDWAEAYLIDVPRPVKKALSEYEHIENLNFDAIRRRFGLPLGPLPPIIWEADERALFTERRDLLAPPPMPWVNEGKVECWPRIIRPLWPKEVRTRLLRRIRELEIRQLTPAELGGKGR